MTDAIEKVRGVMAAAEDIQLHEGADVPPADDAADFDPGYTPPPPRRPAPRSEEEDLPPAARCVDFPLNDHGNGLRLVEHFGPDLVHVPRVGWFTWTGQRFVADRDAILVRRRAHKMTELIEAETEFMDLPEAEMEILDRAEAADRDLTEILKVKSADRTPEQIDRMIVCEKLLVSARDIKARRDKAIGRRLTHAKAAGNTNTINNMMAEAGSIIARPLEDLDADPLVINTEGGVLKFETRPQDQGPYKALPPVRVTMRVLPHERAQLLTKMMPVGLNPRAECPKFEAFLERVQPNAMMRGFLQRWLGYSMTGLKTEQVFAFLYGSGANGKSVLVDLMARMMGDYAATAKIESITGRNRRGGGDATPDLIPLIGARFVRASEPEQGERLQESLIKELTGGEPIQVRALHSDFVEVYPLFKLTISGNHRPEVHGGDDGIWRRVMLIPFEVQIPPEERVPFDVMMASLWEERDGIMQWLIRGLRDYLEYGLRIPDEVLEATAAYREDSDPLATFLTQVCDVTGKPENSIKAKDLQEAFKFWLEESGRGAWKSRTIYNQLSAKQGKWKSPATGQTFTKRKASDAFYDGVSLIEPFKSSFAAYQTSMAGRGARFDD